MELSLILYSLIAFLSFIFLWLNFLIYKQKTSSMLSLPRGGTGWPLLGETIEFLSAGWRGHPNEFVLDRMTKYSPECFRTSLLGQPVAFLCGPSGNKFLFCNENKFVKAWWPSSVKKIFPNILEEANADISMKKRMLLSQFLKQEALQRYIGIMDATAQRHFTSEWENKDDVSVVHLAKTYTFWLACRLFLSVEDPDHIAHFAKPFEQVVSGVISLPINVFGTPFNKAIRAVKLIKKEFLGVINQRKLHLANQKATPTQDILSHMVNVIDENEELPIRELDVVEMIMGLLIGGHDGVSSVITSIVKYLAELPHIYDLVYKEQMEIAKSKAAAELLNWEDIQKMTYSWNVACEVLRLAPPTQGTFTQAITDFKFSGHTIPKGWKLFWSAYSTHRNPEYFPNPEKFDPTRFEGERLPPYTYAPFGGGPRICPGREYARVVILVFIHDVVKRFSWEKLIPDEPITFNPSPFPAKGLHIRLIPHEK